MKIFGVSVLGILIVVTIFGALVLLGPLRALLPSGIRARVDTAIPDYFSTSRQSVRESTLPSQQQNTTGASADAHAWIIMGQGGVGINVVPFMQGMSSLPEKGSFTLGNEATSTDNPAYLIAFYAPDQSFLVTLFAEPLAETRRAAEADLLARLDISNDDACRLKYSVITPQWVNTFYAGKNLGFSFCPGSPAL